MSSSKGQFVKHLTVWDYVVLGIVLFVSAAIGLYYAFTGGRQRTTGEFLMANRQMTVFPVSLSLMATFISSITLLGVPTEMYFYDASFWLMAPAYCITPAITAFLYMPVFFDLKLTSAFEYLELRFNRHIRKTASLLFIIQMTLYIAIVMYAPALALSQVTGLHIWASVATIGIVCIFYTTLGGMKAVMWTNAFQIFIMFGAIIAVVIKGSVDLGGLGVVWDRAGHGNRTNTLYWSPDPKTRHSVWGLLIGGASLWLTMYAVSQAQVQRYLTCPSIKTARWALFWNSIGLVLMICLCCLAGLIIYASYWKCDPLLSGRITKPDQLLPLFVMDALGDYPGLPGFFVAGIFSAALSSISAAWNSLAAVTLKDFVEACFPQMTDKVATVVSKVLAFLYGLLSIALVAVAQELGNIVPAILSIFGLIGGPVLGLFSLGMFFPCIHSIDAAVGLVVSFTLTLWIMIGALVNEASKYAPRGRLDVGGCPGNITLPARGGALPEILPLYRLSYIWYSPLAAITVVIIGLIVSCISRKQKAEDLDPALISPVVAKFYNLFPEKIRKCCRCDLQKAASKTSQQESVPTASIVEVN